MNAARKPFRRLFAFGGDYYVRALACQSQRQRFANSPAGPGDHGDAAPKIWMEDGLEFHRHSFHLSADLRVRPTIVRHTVRVPKLMVPAVVPLARGQAAVAGVTILRLHRVFLVPNLKR